MPASVPAADDPEPWARALRRGDPEALDPWFRAEYPTVWRLCLGLCADSDQAADLAQDALLRLEERLHLWDPARPYAPWRNALVANLCRDRARRARTRSAAEQDAAAARLAAPWPAPDSAASASEVRAVLTAVLAALPPREREAFVLRDLEQRSTAETARTLGVTEGTVRSLLTLARRRLRELVGRRTPGLVPEGAGE